MLITLLRNADRVKMACLAQLVNVIAPIMTSNGGGAWRQTIFYPYLHVSTLGRGYVLNPIIESPVYDSKNYTDVPILEAIPVVNEEANEITIFAVNKDLTAALILSCDLGNFQGYKIIEHIILENEDVYAINTLSNPNNVKPHNRGNAVMDNGIVTASLPKLSWNVIRLKKQF